jgi:DNA-binding Xre family transcriptional regulator
MLNINPKKLSLEVARTGLTLKELAKKAGMGTQTIRALMKGSDQRTRAKTISRLCTALEVDITVIL